MVTKELLDRVKNFIPVDSDDFDIVIKAHIKTCLAMLEVNHIHYDRITNELMRDLVDTYIGLSVKINFDNNNSVVNNIVKVERDRLWYHIVSFVESEK